MNGETLHQPVLYIALLVLGGALLASLVLIIRGSSAMQRVLALDTFTLLLVGLLSLFALVTRSPYYLDAALVLALLAFVGTLAAARFHSDGEIFS